MSEMGPKQPSCKPECYGQEIIQLTLYVLRNGVFHTSEYMYSVTANYGELISNYSKLFRALLMNV